jgi:hypothetical protein
MTLQTPSLEPKPSSRVRVADYAQVGALLAVFVAVLVFLTRDAQTVPPERVIAPVGALVGLTAAVWLSMVLVRNGTILRGLTRAEYYLDYRSDAPPDWVERPARAFNNLFQVPLLFYVISLFMLVTGRVDSAQIALAWTYVAVRALHATVYIGWNYLPYRFGAWFASCVTLGVIWTRFLLQG